MTPTASTPAARAAADRTQSGVTPVKSADPIRTGAPSICKRNSRRLAHITMGLSRSSQDRAAGVVRAAAPLHSWLDQQAGPDPYLTSRPRRAVTSPAGCATSPWEALDSGGACLPQRESRSRSARRRNSRAAPYRRFGAFFIVGAGGEWRAQISRFGGFAAAEMASWSTYSDLLLLPLCWRLQALGVASCSCQPLAPCGTVPGRCGDGSGEPVLVGVGDGLGSVADAGLGEEMIDVAFYCGLADHQPAGDLYVGQSLGDQCEHFGFSLREPGG